MMGSENCDYGQNSNGNFMNGSAGNSEHSSSSSSYSPCRFFEHPVSNLDTLAGVAIKYGVEVADIRRMNGLVTDRQMFALKTLRIPQPGRHPPSPSLSNGCSTTGPIASVKTPPRRILPDILGSFESLKATPEHKVSPAMSSLQGYYGLGESRPRRTQSEGYELSVYNKARSGSVENGSSIKPSPGSKPPLSLHGKSRSLANVNAVDEIDSENWSDKLLRRRQKSEADFTSRTPEKIIKEENGIGGWFSVIAGKGLALRTKASSRNNLSEANVIADGLVGVRKSSSTPTLQDQDNNNNNSSNLASIWSGSWNLKPEVIAKPILDGWANPITGGKSKTALD